VGEKKYQVFISSTYTDLVQAREKISKQILTLYHFPIGMEMFSAGNEDQWTVITNTIDKSDYYIIILGHRYGSLAEDGTKELIITLTKGYGSGVLDEEVYVYRYANGLIDVIVDNPLAIIYKNVKTKLTTEKAEIILGDKVYVVDTKSIEPSHLFEDISFGSIIDYEVINKNLMVRVSGQVSPAMFVGDIIITYEYRDKMYQAKAIEFITDINKNPFYGPVKH